MTNTFFVQTHCDRCAKSLEGKARKLSWFTGECLCPECIESEQELKKAMRDGGTNPDDYEGCGYVPNLQEY